MTNNKTKYEIIRILIKEGHITRFEQIFDSISRSNLAKDLGMNYQTLTYRLKRPVSFTFEETFAIARLIGIEKLTMAQLIINQAENKTKGKS